MEPERLFASMDAALLDMDGTILDDMDEWRQCNVDYLEQRGIELTPEQRLRVVNSSSGALLIDYVRDVLGIEVDIPAFRTLQQDRMMAVYEKGPPVKAGAREFLDALRGHGVKVVLATATWPEHTIVALNKCRLVHCFYAICCSHMMGCGKNNPDYFKKVSDLIGVPKERCVLFDDAMYALKGGRDAGILGNVAVEDPMNTLFRTEMAALSDTMVDSLADLIPFLRQPV